MQTIIAHLFNNRIMFIIASFYCTQRIKLHLKILMLYNKVKSTIETTK